MFVAQALLASNYTSCFIYNFQ